MSVLALVISVSLIEQNTIPAKHLATFVAQVVARTAEGTFAFGAQPVKPVLTVFAGLTTRVAVHSSTAEDAKEILPENPRSRAASQSCLRALRIDKHECFTPQH